MEGSFNNLAVRGLNLGDTSRPWWDFATPKVKEVERKLWIEDGITEIVPCVVGLISEEEDGTEGEGETGGESLS